jgi:hypothetical protein
MFPCPHPLGAKTDEDPIAKIFCIELVFKSYDR